MSRSPTSCSACRRHRTAGHLCSTTPAVWWASCHPATSPGSCSSPCRGPRGVPSGTDPTGSVRACGPSLPSSRVVSTPAASAPKWSQGRTRIQLTWHRRLVDARRRLHESAAPGRPRTTAAQASKDLVVAEHRRVGSGRVGSGRVGSGRGRVGVGGDGRKSLRPYRAGPFPVPGTGAVRTGPLQSSASPSRNAFTHTVLLASTRTS